LQDLKPANPHRGLFFVCDLLIRLHLILGFAFLLDGENTMPDDPTPPQLYRINQNVMAPGSAIEEIGIWIDQQRPIE
jgi:hypothetical protein